MRVFGIYDHHLPAIALHQTSPHDRKDVMKNWNGNVQDFVKRLDHFLQEDGQNQDKVIGQQYLTKLSRLVSSSETSTKVFFHDREEFKSDL